MIYTFVHTVTKDKEGSYYYLPFSVPENTEKITVTYDYFRPTTGVMSDLKPSNTIDIGLADEKGNFLGWSGSAHRSISVGEFSSSKGYLSQKIEPGEWNIIVGAYHVVEGGVKVKYTIEFEEKRTRLLFGDLHIHSTASDGALDIPEIGKKAVDAGLDFVGIANHNNYSENFFLPHIDGLTFIPAVEWTHYKGHMNFFGVKAPFENSFIANTEDEAAALIEHAKSLGAVISVNHPKDFICPYLWENEDCFDMAEIWNGPMHPANAKSIKWWTSLLKSGKKIAAVGGSDWHREGKLVKFASPVTAVLSPSRSADDILVSIRAGHSFITENKDGARLFIKYGAAVFGDTVKYDKKTKLIVKAENLNGAKVVLVTNRGEIELCRGKKEVYKAEISLHKTNFAYIKAVRLVAGLPVICAISNPIYFFA